MVLAGVASPLILVIPASIRVIIIVIIIAQWIDFVKASMLPPLMLDVW